MLLYIIPKKVIKPLHSETKSNCIVFAYHGIWLNISYGQIMNLLELDGSSVIWIQKIRTPPWMLF